MNYDSDNKPFRNVFVGMGNISMIHIVTKYCQIIYIFHLLNLHGCI